MGSRTASAARCDWKARGDEVTVSATQVGVERLFDAVKTPQNFEFMIDMFMKFKITK